MTSAKVNVQEVDISTRVPQFPGAYGAMAIPAKKGPIGEAVLVTNESQFLATFTPNDTVEVGYDNSHFSAITFLEKSDKLWVARAANSPLFGGLVVRDGVTTGGDNSPLAAGTDDPSAYSFDAGVDVSAVAEVTSVSIPTGAATYDVAGSGLHWLSTAHGGALHYVWYDVTDGGNTQTDPAVAGRLAIKVDILAADSALDIAIKTAAALDAEADYSAVTPVTSTLSYIQASAGVVADASDVDATVTITVSVQGADGVSGVDEVMLIHGSNPGAWNNDLRIVITNYATNPVKVQEPSSFLLEVFHVNNPNTPVEVWTCSRDQSAKNADGSNIFIEDVLEASNYIRATNNPTIPGSVPPKDQLAKISLEGGDDGSAVTDGDMIQAAAVFKNKDNLNATILMDGGFSTPAYQLELDSIAQQRGDCVAILSVPIAKEASSSFMSEIVEYRSVDLNLNSNRSALYTPHVRIYDKFNDRNIWLAPDGYAGGAISSSAANFEIWYPPAGARRGVINALDTRRRFDQAQRDQLQLNGINPIRFTPGRGILIWGQKTLTSRPSALDRLNVRLLLLVIEPAVELALEDFLFELNDTSTRSLAKATIDSFMDNILARRGVTDFRTVIDSTNNSPEDVDNSRMNVDLFIKPTRSVEEINLRVIITRSGVSFDTAATQV